MAFATLSACDSPSPTQPDMLVQPVSGAGETEVEATQAEFAGTVSSASGTGSNGTILLVTNEKGAITEIRVDTATVWQGEIKSLADLIAAVAGLIPVRVEGDGPLGSNGDFITAATNRADFDHQYCLDTFGDQIESLNDLIDQVESLVASNDLTGANAAVLVEKLEYAADVLGECDADEAVQELEDYFIPQVFGFINSGKLGLAPGMALVDAANAILDSI